MTATRTRRRGATVFTSRHAVVAGVRRAVRSARRGARHRRLRLRRTGSTCPGEDLPHVSHYYSEPHPFYRKRVVIVGGKNSAAEAALDLYRAGAQVTIVHRRAALGDSIKYWVKPDIENRIKEGSIAARFDTQRRRDHADGVVVEGQGTARSCRRTGVFLLTGYSSDPRCCARRAWRSTRDLRSVHDPETFETNVPNLFVIGACVAGKQSGKIFIENGRFHGQVAIDGICGS